MEAVFYRFNLHDRGDQKLDVKQTAMYIGMRTDSLWVRAGISNWRPEILAKTPSNVIVGSTLHSVYF